MGAPLFFCLYRFVSENDFYAKKDIPESGPDGRPKNGKEGG